MFLAGDSKLKYDEGDGWFKEHSLSLAVTLVFFLQMLSTIWVGHIQWIKDAQDHSSEVTGWPTDFWTWWAWDYLVSIAAEPWGFLIGVLFTKWFYERKSAESN